MLFLSLLLSTLKKIFMPCKYSFSFFIVLFCSVSTLSAQDFYPEKEGTAKNRLFGLGGQAIYPAAGLSGKFNIGNHASIQGIVGLFALANIELKSIMLRGLFRFNEANGVEPYLFGMVGSWTMEQTSIFSSIQTSLQPSTIKETFPGYGVGCGIEYASKEIPSTALNVEIGYGSLQNKKTTFQFSTITYGVGIHYYIMR